MSSPIPLRQIRRHFVVQIVFMLMLGAAVPGNTSDISAGYPGIGGHLRGFPEGENRIAEIPIEEYRTAGDGIIIGLQHQEAPIIISVIGSMPFPLLETTVSLVRDRILEGRELRSSRHTIGISRIEISGGFGSELLVSLYVDTFLVRLNDAAMMDFTRRLKTLPELRYDPQSDLFRYDFPLTDIDPGTGNGDPFRGWAHLTERLLAWAEDGLARNDQEVMADVLEIRVLTEREAEEQKNIVISRDPARVRWGSLGLTAEAHLPDLLVFSGDGIAAGPEAFLFQSLGYFCVDPAGRNGFRSFSAAFFLGPFIHMDFRSLRDAQYSIYDLTLSRWMALGVTVALGVTGWYPDLDGTTYRGRLIGFGLELQSQINILGIIQRRQDDYTILSPTEYFFSLQPALILHFLPERRIRSDLILGLFLKYLPNQNQYDDREVGLYSAGFDIGLRIRFDLFPLTREKRPGE